MNFKGATPCVNLIEKNHPPLVEYSGVKPEGAEGAWALQSEVHPPTPSPPPPSPKMEWHFVQGLWRVTILSPGQPLTPSTPPPHYFEKSGYTGTG